MTKCRRHILTASGCYGTTGRTGCAAELLLRRGGCVVLKRSAARAIVPSLVLLILGAPSAFACVTSSWITTDPSSGPPGTRITVTGAGFEPGTVMFRWDRSAESGGEVLGEATVGEDGRVSAELIVPDASPGSHKVIAEHTSSSETVAHADAWADFEIPGAATGEGSNAQTRQNVEESSTSDRSGGSVPEAEVADPVAAPVAKPGRLAHPASESGSVVGSSEVDQMQELSSRSYVPMRQAGARLRAVDLATNPVVMDAVGGAGDTTSAAPAPSEPTAWDLRWMPVALVAIAAALCALAFAKWRAPEPEEIVLELPSHPDEEETHQAA